METEGGVLTGDGMRRVALAEMALRRRRLGELTPAQERAIESLLVSIADNISGLLPADVKTHALRPKGGTERDD